MHLWLSRNVSIAARECAGAKATKLAPSRVGEAGGAVLYAAVTLALIFPGKFDPTMTVYMAT
jgi:hypothetical protein